MKTDQSHKKHRWLGSAATGALVAGLTFASASAQQETAETNTQSAPQQASAGSQQEDRILVTGSRIARTPENSPIPAQILGREAIDEIGSVDLGEIIEEIPGAALGLSPNSTLTSTQNAGVSAVSLRNLGSNRTLTLIDGRRTVSNSGNAQRVNLSTIPAGFVDRLEVTTGGASAVYGSDAIAGVVNILLEDDFEGLEVRTRTGVSQDGGEQENTLDITWGTNFADDRGNIMLGLSYDTESEIEALDRDWSLVPVRFNNGVFETNLSSNLPGGRFEGDDAWNIDGVWFNDRSLLPPGRTQAEAFETALDGYNFRLDQNISPALDRVVAGARGRFDFAPNVSGFFNVLYSALETSSIRGYQNASSGTDFGPVGATQDIGTMSSTHPFIPPEVEETRSGSVSWVRRFVEVGRDSRESTRDTLRLWAGLNGRVSDRWDWEAWVSHGQFEQVQTRRNELNFQHIQYALDIESDGAGGFQCVDATARSNGCVPLNIFGTNSITPEMADYIRATASLTQELEQTTFAANMTGDLLDLPAGPVGVAFGFEHRREEQVTDGDDLVATGVTGFAAIPDLTGEYDVNEVFVEANFPLIVDQPLVDALAVDAAIRLAEYSTIGNVSSWKVGGVWTVNDSFRFRGQLAQAQRAPDITELFSQLRGDFDTANDPCDGVTLTSTGTVATNCLTDTRILAGIADNGGVFDQDTTSLFAPNGGNINLIEETAETVTFGVIWTPSFLPNFSAIVDWYDISVEDAIDSVSTQDVLNLCYNAADFPNNRFCDVISRDGLGQIDQIINQDENLNVLNSRGVDVTVNYDDFELGPIPGEFDVSFLYSFTDVLEERFDGPDGSQSISNFVGEVGDSEHQWRAAFGWSHNGWRVTWKVRHIGAAVDDNTVLSSDADYFPVDPWSRHDLYIRYRFDGNPDVSLFGGVNNVFHNYGPFLPSGTDSGGSRNFDAAYDVVGRFFYGGVRIEY